ncbi:MAG: rod-binding protein [Pirellulaceae bacterium]
MNSIHSALAVQPVLLQPKEPDDAGLLQPTEEQDSQALHEAFNSFVGETFFGQLLGAMRKTVREPAYFHGGRAEEVFQGQLDQLLSQHMSEASADSFSDPMFELFNLGRIK